MKGIVGRLAVVVAPCGTARPVAGGPGRNASGPAPQMWSTARPRRGAAVTYAVSYAVPR